MFTCFDAHRPTCSTSRLSIYVYAADSFWLNGNAAFLPWARQPARRFHLVDRPEDACLLIVHGNSTEGRRLGRRSGAGPTWDGGNNHLLWDPNHWPGRHPDSPILHVDAGRAAVAATSAVRSSSARGFDTMLFLHPRQDTRPDKGASSADRHRRLLLSFRGQIHCWSMPWYQHRLLAANYLNGANYSAGPIVIDASCINAQAIWERVSQPAWLLNPRSLLQGSWLPPYATAKDIGYGELLRASKFGLVSGGAAPTSYRFAEMLLAGTVPVLPDNGDMLLPFEPDVDWSGCVVRVEEGAILQLGVILDSIVARGELPARQAECARLTATVIGHFDDYRTTFDHMAHTWARRIQRMQKRTG